jgi:branched-chain amino acid transport system ATP-binding protein
MKSGRPNILPAQARTSADYAIVAQNVCLAFGGQRVLDGVSFELAQGNAVLLKGDNGSGKTTLLNILSGFLRPDTGKIEVRLNGAPVNATHASPERLVRMGVGRLWQDIRLFPTMTVLENVLAATPDLVGQNPLLSLAAWPLVRRQEKAARELAMQHLALVDMADRAESSGDKLSVGQMKRVAIARLLQGGAKLLLLDEPMAGLDDASAHALVATLIRLRTETGKTLLIVEHQHERVSGLCDETWHLADGKLMSAKNAQ